MIPLDAPVFPFAETSFRISLAIGLFLLLRPWLQRLIGSQWLGLLWILLLARLLLPFPVHSPWHLIPSPFSTMGTSADRITQTTVQVAGKDATVSEGHPAKATPPATAASDTMTGLLAMIWLSGVVTGLGGLAIRTLRTRRLAAKALPATDTHLLEIFHSIPSELRGHVGLRTTDALKIPALAHSFHPQIWIPQGWREQWTAREMRHVLLHELGHANRRDLLIQRLFSIAQCLHWFNPLIWVASHYARLDREMACDAWVLTQCGEEETAAYGMTLVKTARWLHHSPAASSAGILGMASTRKKLWTRVTAIGHFTPVSTWRGWAGSITTLAALALLTTVGKTTAQETTRKAVVTSRQPSPPASPLWVRVDAKLLHLSDADIDSIGKSFQNPPSAVPLASNTAQQLLSRLFKRPGVEVITLPTVTTGSGLAYQIDIVEPVRFATHFSPKRVATAFTTREVGLKLEATPTVAPDGETISIDFGCEITQLKGYTQYWKKEAPTVWLKPKAQWLERLLETSLPAENPLNQPLFSTWEVTSSISCWHGQGMLFLGPKPEAKTPGVADSRRVLLMLTPTIVKKQKTRSLK